MSQAQQADHLRRHAAYRQGPPTADRVAVVFGAKGGVGASAVALSLGRDLAKKVRGAGVGVLAVDAHASRDDLRVLVGQNETAGLALTSAVKLGVEPAAGQGPSVAEQAKRLLRAARLWTDDTGGWIVVDAGVGDTLWARELASRAARPLLVTTTDPLSLTNGYAALKLMDALAARVGLIVNHCEDERAAQRTHATIANACQQFFSATPTLAGWLPTLTADDPTEAQLTATAA